MARKSEQADAQPPGALPNVSPVGATPTHEHSFLLQQIIEVGRAVAGAEAKLDRLIQDVESQGEKVSKITHQVSWIKGAMWVLGGLIVLTGILFRLYMDGKLAVAVLPGSH